MLKQEQPLILRFHPRGDGGNTKGRGQGDDGSQNGGATGIAEAGAHEESIDLEAIDQQGAQIAKEEQPVPKSLLAMGMPLSFSRRSRLMAR